MVRETVPRSSRRFTAGTGRRCSLNVCWFRWKIRVRKQSGLTAIITAGAQEIKYEKAAGELPVKGEMKKQQVNCLQRGKWKSGRRMPVSCVISDYDGRSVRNGWPACLSAMYPKKCQKKILSVHRKQWLKQSTESVHKLKNWPFARRIPDRDRTWNIYSPNMGNIQIVSMYVI